MTPKDKDYKILHALVSSLLPGVDNETWSSIANQERTTSASAKTSVAALMKYIEEEKIGSTPSVKEEVDVEDSDAPATKDERGSRSKSKARLEGNEKGGEMGQVTAREKRGGAKGAKIEEADDAREGDDKIGKKNEETEEPRKRGRPKKVKEEEGEVRVVQNRGRSKAKPARRSQRNQSTAPKQEAEDGKESEDELGEQKKGAAKKADGDGKGRGKGKGKEKK